MKTALIIILTTIFTLNLNADSLLDRIKELDEKIYTVNKEIQETQSQINTLEEKIEITKRKLKKLKSDNKKTEKKVKERIKYLFKMLNSEIFTQLDSKDALIKEKNEKYLKIIVSHDLKLIKNYLKELKKIKTVLSQYDTQIKKLKNIKSKLLLKKQEYENEKKQKKEFVKKIGKSKKLKNKLKKEQKDVEKKLTKKLKATHKDRGFYSMKGKLDFPVNAKVHKWYYVKYLKKHHTYEVHKGLTFKVPYNTRVYSIYKGNVVFSSYIKGYGNTIIIAHGDGYYSIYMHLNKIIKSRGERVKTHQLIALSGDTGATEYPKLYFEIRKNKDPVNLNKWFIIKKR